MAPDKVDPKIQTLIDKPQEALAQVDAWADSLAAAIAAKRAEELCLLGRQLTYAAILASLPTHSGLWNEDRIRRVLKLLVEAIPASKGTDFHRNCVDRPRNFMDGLRVALCDNPEALRMLNRIAKEYQEAVDKGLPVLCAC